MFSITKNIWKFLSLLILLAGLCLLGVPRADAVIYDANADFSITKGNPNGVWTYGWASTVASIPTNLHKYPDNGTLSFGSGLEQWYDQSNNVSYTPLVYKNTGPEYIDSGNAVDIPAGALILHGGGTGLDLSVVEFTAPSAGQYALSATFIGRQDYIYYGRVYILDNGVILFNNTSANYIFDKGDTQTFSTILTLSQGEKIDFVVGRDNEIGADSIELQAQLRPVPIPGAVWLLGSGLLGLAGLRRFRKG
jgi:hypothetical protein